MSPPATKSLWDHAIEHHLAGRLPPAEVIYRQLLSQEPAHARALHMLGVLRYQSGDCEAALELIDRAIAIDDTPPEYHGHRGLILAATGKVEPAIAAYRQALIAAPRMPDVLNNLANALRSQGETAGAIAAYRRALAAQPNFAEAAVNLGLALIHAGDYAEAITVLEQAARLKPGNASVAAHLAAAHNNHGVMLERQGNAEQAMRSFITALTLKCDFAEAHFNLGKALMASSRLDEAIAAYQRAIALRPDLPSGHNNLGVALFGRGRLDEAIASYREALRQRPDDAQASNNLGSSLRIAGRLHEAVAAYHRALEIEPRDAETWNNLGSLLDSRGDSEPALEAFRQALEIRPAFSEAQNNLGNALKNLGELDGALEAYRRAIDLRPDNQEAHSNRLYTMYFHAEYPPDRIGREHRQWNAEHAAKLEPACPRFDNDRSATRRLRVGYVAATFRDHCQSFFTMPLWANHDHDQVEVIAYSDTAAQDSVTAKLRGCCDGWRHIAGLSDDAVAEQVRRDRVDILVDLSLHMAHNRLLVMARKPAPLQVTWLGYPGTTGLNTVDYRLTDPYLDPPAGENDAFYSEASYRLPHTFWCYDPLASEPLVNALPANRNGQFTFGCLNNFCKVDEETLRLWAAVMRATPNSKLLLLAPLAARQRVVESLERHGIAASRVEFLDRAPRARYLAYYHRIDLGLDTIPYNGHTTSLDSMWMGVPVVTLIGSSAAGRAGWSQLSNLGLERLYAAASADGFVRLAVAACENLAELSNLRANLRDRLANSPLCDGAAFARDVEAAYRVMWQRYLTTER